MIILFLGFSRLSLTIKSRKFGKINATFHPIHKNVLHQMLLLRMKVKQRNQCIL